MQEIIIPKNAAAQAAIKLFIVELNILSLVSICFQNLNEIFLADKGLPILIVTEVRATVINGTITTIKEKIETNIVRGVLHFPKSTIVGLVDFPLQMLKSTKLNLQLSSRILLKL